MKQPKQAHVDESLSRLLQTWQVEVADDPELAWKVWRRLDANTQSSDSTPGTWLESLSALLARPAMAMVVVAIFAVAGAMLAELQDTHQREARLDQLAAEYVRSIDPVLMTDASHPAHHP
jgi:hypothetical protein